MFKVIAFIFLLLAGANVQAANHWVLPPPAHETNVVKQRSQFHFAGKTYKDFYSFKCSPEYKDYILWNIEGGNKFEHSLQDKQYEYESAKLDMWYLHQYKYSTQFWMMKNFDLNQKIKDTHTLKDE